MSESERCKALVLGGVPISGDPEHVGVERPYPDYVVLREALRADVADVDTISTVRDPAIGLIRKRLGPLWAIALWALLHSNRYRIVFAAGEDVGLRYGLLSLILPRRAPLIVVCHNISTRRPRVYLHRLRVDRVVARFLCLSESQAEILTRRYGIPSKRLEVIYWMVDHHFFRPGAGKPIRNQICSAGMESRDYATLVQACRNLDVDVKIAADTPWFRRRLNISAESLPPHIEVRSYGNYQALRRLYAESQFVVVPLMDVDFSAGYTVILEAMAMGKAVIASRTQQADDFIVDGWNGYHVTPGDPDELRQRICYLLAHPDEARDMGLRGRRLVEERYTLNHYRERITRIVDEVQRT